MLIGIFIVDDHILFFNLYSQCAHALSLYGYPCILLITLLKDLWGLSLFCILNVFSKALYTKYVTALDFEIYLNSCLFLIVLPLIIFVSFVNKISVLQLSILCSISTCDISVVYVSVYNISWFNSSVKLLFDFFYFSYCSNKLVTSSQSFNTQYLTNI